MQTDPPIKTFEELMDHVMWDWPDGMYPQGEPKIRLCKENKKDITGMNGYEINKTFIFPDLTEEDNGDVTAEFILEYKTSRYTMPREVYEKFKIFYELLYQE